MNLCGGLSCPTQISMCGCVCVFVVSIVLVMGVRKESPASSFPLVAWSDDDVMVGGLEVQGTMGNYLTQTYTYMQSFFRNDICVVVIVVLITTEYEGRKPRLRLSPSRNIVLCQQYISVPVCERAEGLGKR